MDRSDIIGLVSVTYSTDSMGQKIPVESVVNRFCSVRSVSANEWSRAGEHGIKAELVVRLLRHEYSGEKTVKHDGVRYSVYRTYAGTGELVELYLQKDVGA